MCIAMQGYTYIYSLLLIVSAVADVAAEGSQGTRQADDFFISAASLSAQGTPQICMQPTALHPSSPGYFR